MYLRDLTTLDDCRRVVELEREVWGYTDAEDVVPAPILIVTVKRGGILIGAFTDAGEMIGFVYSLPAVKAGHLTQWSHMLGVLPAHRGSGAGRLLKLEQRQRAVEHGLDLIEWTYDPLQATNAHLNFHRLGVVVGEYEENIYGESSSLLHRGTPTDRFVAEWWLRSSRVEHRIASDAAHVNPTLASFDAPAVNRIRPCGDWVECEGYALDLEAQFLWVDIPTSFSDMQRQAPNLAGEWRLATRGIFTSYFARGYRAIEFLLERTAGRGRYLLTRDRESAAEEVAA